MYVFIFLGMVTLFSRRVLTHTGFNLCRASRSLFVFVFCIRSSFANSFARFFSRGAVIQLSFVLRTGTNNSKGVRSLLSCVSYVTKSIIPSCKCWIRKRKQTSEKVNTHQKQFLEYIGKMFSRPRWAPKKIFNLQTKQKGEPWNQCASGHSFATFLFLCSRAILHFCIMQFLLCFEVPTRPSCFLPSDPVTSFSPSRSGTHCAAFDFIATTNTGKRESTHKRLVMRGRFAHGLALT